MIEFLALSATAPAVLLLACVLVPSRRANANAGRFRRYVIWLAGFQSVFALLLGIARLTGVVPDIAANLFGSPEGLLSGTIRYDGVAGLMLALVAFVGWIVCRYSARYLDGEPNQGDYFRWTAFVVGAVSLMVVTGNLLCFVVAWVMTSAGLHHLLLHYGDRPAARRAAWTKFVISRVGDAALLGAVFVIYGHAGTLEFAGMLDGFSSHSEVDGAVMHWAALLLAIGAIMKSAQVPFHTWLPLTMETPTPVSALMHAGIVNAGGYLMIRSSPLLVEAPYVMVAMAVIGAVTACFGATVMLTQTSVKKSLAYSTIAQMGFMMLQCGLGAFSAAMLHLVAHSLYKAHAFLASGGVLQQPPSAPLSPASDRPFGWLPVVGVAIAVAAVLAVSMATFGIDPLGKPGGVLLSGVVCLGITSWITQTVRTGSRDLLIRSSAVAGLLLVAYAGAFWTVDGIVAASVPAVSPTLSGWLLASVILLAFAAVFVIQHQIPFGPGRTWVNAWYVHLSNGLYVESYRRNVLGALKSA